MSNKERFVFHTQDFSAASVPIYQEVVKNKPFVFYGEDNLFPQHLIALYQYSSINRACINSIVYGVKGKDIIVKDGDPNRIGMANKNETLYDVFQKCVTDRILFGGFALNIIKSNDNGIAEIYHSDFSRWRSGKQDDFGNINKYYYSIDWYGTTYNEKKYKPVEIPAFNLNDESPSQLLYVKKYVPGMDYYTAPDWVAGITTVQTDIEIKNFHLNNLQNSLLPSMAVSFTNGIPSEEERDQIYRQLEAKYSSTNNAGKFLLFFSENPETTPVITPIPNNASDGWYSNIAAQIEQAILTSHRITSPMILGIRVSGTLGGRNEMLDAYDLFLQTVIKPIQNEMITTFEKILFLKDKQPIKIEIVQNQILSNEMQEVIDKVEGV